MGKSVKLKRDLVRRAREHASRQGYSSLEEFVEHVLEKELSRFEDAADRKEVERRLKGLGYIE